jgi:cytochrome c oxidase subunit 2
VPSVLKPESTPANTIYHLSFLVIAINVGVFAVVFGLLVYVLIRFRHRNADVRREPAQVYGSTQIELAWTVIPVLIVLILFLATARAIHGIQDALASRWKQASRMEKSSASSCDPWSART